MTLHCVSDPILALVYNERLKWVGDCIAVRNPKAKQISTTSPFTHTHPPANQKAFIFITLKQ